jgi:DNA repair protein RecN (Recombination protein N)
MLAFLRVKGFAIIDELSIEFKEGLNVLTGETGAGKSMIINALTCLLNARTPTDVVRSTADHAEVFGHCFHAGQEYILKRIIGNQGRSRAFINENPVTAKYLEELGEALVHVYGQNESQQLLSRESYVSVVDRFLGIQADTAILSEKVKNLTAVRQKLESQKTLADTQAKEADLLSYQIEEIDREGISDDEEDKIRQRLKILKDAARIKNVLNDVERGLYEDEQSVHASLGVAATVLRPLTSIEWMENLKKKIEALSFDVEDIISSIRGYEKDLECEPQELEELDDRLSTILRLKDKYGKTHGSIGEFRSWAHARLDQLNSIKTDVQELETEKEFLEKEVSNKAEELSRIRQEGSGKIESLITHELIHLSMKGVRFRVFISRKDSIGEDGQDDIEFLLSTNPGEPLKPLRRVASGGELSRIMLAIKKITGDDEDRTFVFDEIDAGIGGRVAELVGRRLKELSATHQVICITHLPQIAALGDHHFLVRKHQRADSTSTDIREIDNKERIEEIARMLGGIKITTKTIEQAEEMLRNAQESTN